MPTKRPTKADRMMLANYIRSEAVVRRKHAGDYRNQEESELGSAAANFRKFATREENKAAWFEMMADWVVGDV